MIVSKNFLENFIMLSFVKLAVRRISNVPPYLPSRDGFAGRRDKDDLQGLEKRNEQGKTCEENNWVNPNTLFPIPLVE